MMLVRERSRNNWAAEHMVRPEAAPLEFDDAGDWAKGAEYRLVSEAAIEKAIELLELVSDDPNGGQAKLAAVDLSDFLEPFIGIRIKPLAFLNAARKVVEAKGKKFSPHTSIQVTRRSR